MSARRGTQRVTVRPRSSPYRRFTLLGALVALGLALLLAWLLDLPLYLAWLVGLSVATFLIYGWDKRRARRAGERVPELVLHGLALAGGFAGGWLGRSVYRHKTLHRSFTVVLTLATLLHLAIAIWLVRR